MTVVIPKGNVKPPYPSPETCPLQLVRVISYAPALRLKFLEARPPQRHRRMIDERSGLQPDPLFPRPVHHQVRPMPRPGKVKESALLRVDGERLSPLQQAEVKKAPLAARVAPVHRSAHLHPLRGPRRNAQPAVAAQARTHRFAFPASAAVKSPRAPRP